MSSSRRSGQRVLQIAFVACTVGLFVAQTAAARALVDPASSSTRAAQAPARAAAKSAGSTSAVWTDVKALSPDGLPADSPSLVADLGMTTVVWRAFDGSHWRIQEAHRPAGGSWSTPAFASPPGMDAASPQVARIGPGQRVPAFRLVAWLAGNTEPRALRVAMQLNDRAWSTPLTLSAASRRPTDVIVMANRYVDEGCDGCGPRRDRNLPSVFWRDFDGSHWRVRAAQLTSDGTAVDRAYALSRAGRDAEDLALWGDPQWGTKLSWSRWNGSYWRGEYVGFEYSLPDIDYVHDLPFYGEDQRAPVVGWSGAIWTNQAGGVTRLRGTICSSLPNNCARHPVTLSSPDAGVTSVLSFAESNSQEVAVWQEQPPGSQTRVASAVTPTPDYPLPADYWTAVTYLSADGVETGPATVSRPTDGWPLVVLWSQPGNQDGMVWSTFGIDGPVWSSPSLIGVVGDPLSQDVTDLNAGGAGSMFGPDALTWSTDASGTAQVMVRGLDWRAPVVTRIRASKRVPVDVTPTLRWAATDDWSTVASYDINQYAVVYPNHRGTTSRLLSATDARSITLDWLKPGGSYCYSARARDSLGHLSLWADDWYSCVQVPLDDRTFTRATTGWSRRASVTFYRGSALVGKRRGSMLTIATEPSASLVKLLVATGPHAGKLLATLGRRTRILDLATPQATTRHWMTLFNIGAPEASGTIRLKVISRGKPVWVDGVLLSRE